MPRRTPTDPCLCPLLHPPGVPRRRFQWLFVRIEVELRKIQAHRPELGTLVPLATDRGYAPLDHRGAPGSPEPDGGGSPEPRRGSSAGAVATPPSAGKKQQARAREKKIPMIDFDTPHHA